MKLTPALILLLSIAAILPVATAAAKPPDFPVPRSATTEIVGNNMAVGGRQMDIRQFYSRDRLEKFKDFYYRKWARGENGSEPGYVETDVNPPWHIITRVEKGYLMTVQVQRADDGGSWGYLATSRLKQDPSSVTQQLTSIPRMADSEVVHSLQSRDIGQSGNTLMLENKHSLSGNINYYRRYYRQRGWREDMDQPIAPAGMHVLAFTKGRDKINIVLTGNHKKTSIVVNSVTHDIL